MADDTTLDEIDERIALVRENLRQLMEQAAAVSGAASEDRAADLISDQEEKLAMLLAEREALSA
jgi:hypothetical protein